MASFTIELVGGPLNECSVTREDVELPDVFRIYDDDWQVLVSWSEPARLFSIAVGEYIRTDERCEAGHTRYLWAPDDARWN